MPQPTAVILATGPSLRSTWNAIAQAQTERHGWPVIAVNHALSEYTFNTWPALCAIHWVFGDFPVYRDVIVNRKSMIPTNIYASEQAHREYRKHTTHRPPKQWQNWATRWNLDETTFSATAALHLARDLIGPGGRVITHGVDHAGDHHFHDQPGSEWCPWKNDVDQHHAKDRRQWLRTLDTLQLHWQPATVPEASISDALAVFDTFHPNDQEADVRAAFATARNALECME